MKAMKKIMSLLLVVAMAMSLSLTAFAAEPTIQPRAVETAGVITVSGKALKGKDVTIVRMFTSNIGADAATVGYTLESQWQEFFNQQLSKNPGTAATSQEAYEYVAKLLSESTNPDQGTTLIDFAKKAKEAYTQNKDAFNDVATTQKATTDDSVTFSNLTSGYYLVLPASGSTSANRVTDAMLVNVRDDEAAEIQLKTEYPTVDKTVTPAGGHGTSAQIGDELTFTLTSKVPNMADYTTYVFNFKDTMSKGLTLDKESINVTIGDHEIVKDGKYEVTVTPQPETGETVLEIKFSDLKKVTEATAGAKIKVEYTATLNKDAQVGTNKSNDNKAELEYSNDPTTGGTGTSEPSITKTYTFDIQIHKYANNEKGTQLPGAVFQLQSEDGNVIKLVKEPGSEHIYRVATQGEAEAKETFVTVADHNIVIKGLKAGKYQLEEIHEPEGYNPLPESVKLEIQAQHEKDGSLSVGYPKYVVTGAATTEGNIIEVQNRSGAFLPETGSIGTIGLTMLGVALVIGGIGFTSRKKKEQE